MSRFIVSIRTAQAPMSGRGKYRRPVNVRVLDSTACEWHAVRRLRPGLVGEWSNVDSRYSGPNAAFGQALRSAKSLADELNREHEAALMVGSGI